MLRSFIPALFAFAVMAHFALSAEPSVPSVFTGKVLPLSAIEKDPLASGVALVSDDGKTHRLLNDPKSKLLFLDKQLHDRPVRLTGRIDPETKKLKVEKVQTVKNGKVFNVDYWCEACQLAANEPGKCKCCGAETALRELPAK